MSNQIISGKSYILSPHKPIQCFITKDEISSKISHIIVHCVDLVMTKISTLLNTSSDK